MNQEEEATPFTCYSDNTFSQLFDAYYHKKGLVRGELCFLLEGRRMNGYEGVTLASMEVGDGDRIHVQKFMR